jgi:hypothetical protein
MFPLLAAIITCACELSDPISHCFREKSVSA